MILSVLSGFVGSKKSKRKFFDFSPVGLLIVFVISELFSLVCEELLMYSVESLIHIKPYKNVMKRIIVEIKNTP